MPLVFAASEDAGLQAQGGALVMNTTAGEFNANRGRAAIDFNASGQAGRIVLPAAVTTGQLRFTTKGALNTGGTPQQLLQAYTSALANLFRIEVASANTCQLQYWNGSAWTDMGAEFTYDGSALTDWLVVWKTGSGGYLMVIINNALKIKQSFPTSLSAAQFFDLCTPDGTGPHFSQIAVFNGSRSLADTVVETEAPTASSATDAQGTGTVDDVDDVDAGATQIVLGTAGHKHAFTSPARTQTKSSVLGVSVSALLSGDSETDQARFYITIGGTRYYGTPFTLSVAKKGYQYTWPTNPATGLEWTPTDANDATLEWGVEAVAVS